MVATNVATFVDRTYREMAPYQWVREAVIQNPYEAGATEVHVTVDWHTVARHGVYRRVIADNGPGIPLNGWNGIDAHPLERFFNQFGGTGKPIGGAHDNFGIGAKAALLPWNPFGLVVISYTEDDPEGSMIHLRRDPQTGDYGLRRFATDEGWHTVVAPHEDPDLECDWTEVSPPLVRDAGHGLVLVLLGDGPRVDTVLGDPRDFDPDKPPTPGVDIVTYVSRRYWALPLSVRVDEYQGSNPETWPTESTRTVADESKRKGHRVVYRTRTVDSACDYVFYEPAASAGGHVAHHDVQELTDGTKIHWMLWDGPDPDHIAGRDKVRYAPANGYIAALYRGELYELRGLGVDRNWYRTWGISEASVRKRLWLIAEPVESDEHGQGGVYPSSDRSHLYLHASRRNAVAGKRLPWDAWATEFAMDLPQPIIEAMKDARAATASAEEVMDEESRRRLIDRFGKRWRRPGFIANQLGTKLITPKFPSKKPRTHPAPHPPRPPRPPRPAPTIDGGAVGPLNASLDEGGSVTTNPGQLAVALPEATWRSEKDHDFEPGQFAEWNPPSTDHPFGLIVLNRDHPVMIEEVEHWTAERPDHEHDAIVKIIEDVYATIAIGTVAHGESLRRVLPDATMVDTRLRDPWALTAALLGLVAQYQMIATRIGGRLSRRVG
jgi:hypothetical protein